MVNDVTLCPAPFYSISLDLPCAVYVAHLLITMDCVATYKNSSLSKQNAERTDYSTKYVTVSIRINAV